LDLQRALQRAKLSDWLGKRVFHEISEVSRHLFNTYMLLERHQDFVEGWTEHSSIGNEQKVTAAVAKHLKDLVQLQMTEIITDDGSVLCEFDGAVIGKLDGQAVLVFVEARRCIKAEHLESVIKRMLSMQYHCKSS